MSCFRLYKHQQQPVYDTLCQYQSICVSIYVILVVSVNLLTLHDCFSLSTLNLQLQANSFLILYILGILVVQHFNGAYILRQNPQNLNVKVRDAANKSSENSRNGGM